MLWKAFSTLSAFELVIVYHPMSLYNKDEKKVMMRTKRVEAMTGQLQLKEMNRSCICGLVGGR